LGIENECCCNIPFSEPIEQSIEECCFPRPDFACEQKETLAALNAVGQSRQSFLCGLRQIQVSWIRTKIKGQVLQPKEVLYILG